MIRLARTEVRDEVDYRGEPVTLVGRVWSAWLETPWFGVGGSYHRPHRVEMPRTVAVRSPIRDHVMAVRMTVTVALAVAALLRRSRR